MSSFRGRHRYSSRPATPARSKDTRYGQRHREVVQLGCNGYRELVEGETVTFDVAQGQNGPRAENIVRD